MTLTYKRDLEPPGYISRSKIISFKSYCPARQTDRKTDTLT